MRQSRFVRTAALVAALGLGTGMAASIGGLPLSDAAAAAPVEPAESTAAAEIDTFQFKPRSLEVKAGTKVVWTNMDDVTHTVTSGTPEQRSTMFDSTLNGKGTKFGFTFRKAYGHMSMIADPLAEAIVKQFAERFAE
jgi:plastocyanin